jgi:hypothetical protein
MRSVPSARLATEAEAVRNAPAAGERLAAVDARVSLLCCSCRLVDLSCARNNARSYRLVHRLSPYRSGTHLLVGSSGDRGWGGEVRWRFLVGRTRWRRSRSGWPLGRCYIAEGGSS